MPSARLTKHETIQQMKAWAKLPKSLNITTFEAIEDLLHYDPRKDGQFG